MITGITYCDDSFDKFRLESLKREQLRKERMSKVEEILDIKNG
jgi:hypothetical protein